MSPTPRTISGSWYCTVHGVTMKSGRHRCAVGNALRIRDCDPHYLIVGPSVREGNGRRPET